MSLHSRLRAGLALLPGLALLACASVPSGPATCGPPQFPYHEGWLGGDAAYSVPLDLDHEPAALDAH